LYVNALQIIATRTARKFLAIERRHEDIVQIELDHASNSGHWFNFMEIDMEHG